MSRGTIKLPESEYEKHNERRKQMGLTWVEYIDDQAPKLADEIKTVVEDAIEDALSE
jgi:hypothetical protein